MYSPVIDGRNLLLFKKDIIYGRKSNIDSRKKWCNFRVSVKLVQNSFVPNSFSSASVAADVSLGDSRKGKSLTVSYLGSSLGLSTQLTESISRKVSFEEKGNSDSVLSLLRSYGFTESQISSIITGYPRLLVSDAEKSLGPKLKFLQSRGASSSELTEIVSTVPKILGMKEKEKSHKTISVYYDLVKEIIEVDKSFKFGHSFPEGSKQKNIIRNILVLRELGMPQKNLLSLVFSNFSTIWGKEKFEESVKKVVEIGSNPTSLRFVDALNFVYLMSDKTLEEKVNIYKRLGFAEEDVWEIFKKFPAFLAYSEKKILNSVETFLGLGFSKDEFTMMGKRFPQCLNLSAESVKKKTEFVVKKMNWPLKSVFLHPQVLGYSMEKRIVPRCNVIKALFSKGLIGTELPPMGSVFASTNQVFLKSYVRKHKDDKELVAELIGIFSEEKK